jgi:hypothetical protein
VDEKPKRKLTCMVSAFRMHVSGYQELRNIEKEKVQQSRRILISGMHSIMQDIGIYRGQPAPAYGRTRVGKTAPFWKLRTDIPSMPWNWVSTSNLR